MNHDSIAIVCGVSTSDLTGRRLIAVRGGLIVVVIVIFVRLLDPPDEQLVDARNLEARVASRRVGQGLGALAIHLNDTVTLVDPTHG